MVRILIGNEFNEDRAGIIDAKQKKTAWWTQRLAWFARNDDILVMAVAPDEEFLRHVTGVTGTDHATLRIVVPPPGGLGVGVLTADRLAAPALLAELRAALHGRHPDAVISLHPDTSIAELSTALGAQHALAGHSFLSQAGGRLVNSKAAFRAIAAGAGVAIPEGGVSTTPAQLVETAGRLLDRDLPVILKHEFRAGGRGNEIVTPYEGITPVGAQRAVTVRSRAEFEAYVERRWSWLTSNGQSPLVVERYHPGSRALFAEYSITDKGVDFGGQGELISAPLAAAEIIPAPDVADAAVTALLDGGRALSEPLHAMGYRGTLSADAILTNDGQILFTEYNGRITGSTPVYAVFGEQVIGPQYSRDRVLFDRDGWPVPSFAEAVAALDRSGLAYSSATGLGAVLVTPYNTSNGSVRYCLAAACITDVWRAQERIEALFAGTTS
ncbi:peptide ligase PGM1-related protein [Dactylosporangium sp. NPDC051485]|uniref:preATP grasp domain-containing protein n=1 Tax=Dactylosporangium sp. NPDC051485 TaxID=3154846 RepID=UPI003438BC55